MLGGENINSTARAITYTINVSVCRIDIEDFSHPRENHHKRMKARILTFKKNYLDMTDYWNLRNSSQMR